MKAEKWKAWAVAGALGVLTALGAVGCLSSGFGLNVEKPAAMVLGILGFTLLCAFCLLWKRGGLLVLGLAALVAGFSWRSGNLVGSLSTVAAEITDRFYLAYGWPVLGTAGGRADEGLLALGCLIGGIVGWTVVRRKNGTAAMILSLVPLGLCAVVTDTAPGSLWLLLLLAGVLELLLTSHIRRSDPGQANTLAAMAAAPVALLLGGLLLAAPRDTYVNRAEEYRQAVLDWAQSIPRRWEELTEGWQAQEVMSGLDGAVQLQSVDLSAQGPRELMSYPVMDVIAPREGRMYLREQDYDSYDGKLWQSSRDREEIFGGADPDLWKRVGAVTICTRRERDVRCLPYYPADPVTLAGGSMDNTGELSIYEVAQSELAENWRQQVTESRAREGTAYLQLPKSTRKWAQALTEEILEGQTTATEKAEAIGAYVRRSAAYDLQTGAMPAGETDFARWFLEDSETGYCVHFATATAVLLRAAGVESRYVTGYLFSTAANQPVTVTAAEAHAWVEYYEPALGIWIPLESTPSSRSGAEPGTVGTAPPVEKESTPPSGETAGREPETLPTEKEGEKPGNTPLPGWAGAVLGICLTVAGAAGAAMLQRWARLTRRRAAMARGGPNQRALALWREVRRYARALREEPPGELETLAEKAKYSQHTLNHQELSQFRAYLTRGRERCAEKPWHGRLVDRWVRALY